MNRLQQSALFAMVGVSALACAQTAPNGSRPAGDISVAVTYTAASSGLSGGNTFWMQGGSIEIAGTALYGFGEVAKITGLHSGNTGYGVPLSMVIATFGPRYTWMHRYSAKRSVAIFGQGLVGEANGFDSLFPATGAAIHSAKSMATQVGGGVDLSVSPHFSLRLLEASWLHTQLPNSATNVQNDVALGSGAVFHWQ